MKKSIQKIVKHPFVIVLATLYFIAWSWVFVTDSLDLAGSKPVAMVIATWVALFNVTLSVYIVVKIFRFLRKKFKLTNPWLIIALGLPLFALMDFLVSWITAVIWIGPEGSIDNVIPLASPTLVLINTPLGYTTRFVGFYGLAGLFWLTVFLLSRKSWRKYAFLCFVVTCVLSLAGYLMYRHPDGRSISATIVSENLDNHVGVLKDRNSSIVVFPEYSFDNIDNERLGERLGKNQDGSKTYFVGSAQVNNGQPAGHHNVLRFGNSENGIESSQKKYRLIPAGEDLSYIMRTMLRATNQKSTLDYFSYAKMVIKGEHPLQPLKIDDQTILGSAVCSSIIAPKDYRVFARQGATIFTNSASLTIFRGSRVFAWQQKSLARFMSVANSRYFLQSANAATAYELDNNGRQLAEVRGIEAKDIKVVTNSTKTVYTYIGEFLVAIGMLITGGWLVKLLLDRTQSNKNHKKRVSKKPKK